MPVLPPEIFHEDAMRVVFLLRCPDGKFLVARAQPDTAAEHSVMDHELAKELGVAPSPTSIEVTTATGSHEVHHFSAEVALTSLFPGSSRSPVNLKHSFILAPLSHSRDGAHFLLGAELLKVLFPEAVAAAYYCRTADGAPVPTLLDGALSASEAAHGAFAPMTARKGDQPQVAAPSDRFNLFAAINALSTPQVGEGSSTLSLPQTLQALSELPSDDSGVQGELPINEQSERITVFNTDGSDQQQERKQAMVKLSEALQRNAAITGPCNVPEAICHLELNEEAMTKKYRAPYKIAEALHPFVDKQIQHWLDSGCIKPAPIGCRYNTPLTCAPKKDDQGKLTAVRVCLDSRYTNLHLVSRDMHEIPLVADILGRLAGCLLFGEFDLSDAYLQFPLAEDSQEYTAFTWRGRQYIFTRCIYGIAAIPNFFQRIMSRVFADLPFVRPYLDNLPFGSLTWDEHVEHARLIIERCNGCNLKIKQSAMKIGYTAMRCLGHMVTKRGIALDPDKQLALQAIPFPTTGATMRSFLGAAGYLRSHVRHYGDLAAPLEAVKNQDRVEVTPLLDYHFTLLKRAIAQAPVLRFPQPGLPFRLATDASRTGIGGVLYQPTKEGEGMTAHNIIEITSKASGKEERRFSAYKKELQAIVHCLRRFHPLLWGRPGLVIETDHRPLTYMFVSETLSPALQQWLDVLVDYDFKIEHRPGILNVLPDALSRLYEQAYRTEAWGIGKLPRPEVVLPSTALQSSHEELIKASLEKDNEDGAKLTQELHVDLLRTRALARVRALTRRQRRRREQEEQQAMLLQQPLPHQSSVSFDGAPAPTFSLLQPSLPQPAMERNLPKLPQKDETEELLPTDDDRVNLVAELEKRGKRAPASASGRQALIQEQHALGHFGRQAVYDALFHRDLWWPSMHKDIERELLACDACLRFNVAKRGYRPAMSVHASKPGDHFQVDLSVHLPESPDGYKAVLHLIDVFTGFVVLRPLKTEQATEVAQQLYAIFMLLGWPKVLQSDNGPQFVSDVVRRLNQLLGVNQRFISAYNPRVDGKVERSIGTVMQSIKKLLHGTDHHWPLFLDFAQYVYNIKIHQLTGSSPFVLWFNREPNELKDYTVSPLAPVQVSLDDWQQHQEKLLSVIYPAIDERIRALSEQTRKRLNKHRRTLLATLPIGATVMRLDPRRRDKRDARYLGPYTIARRAASGTYILRDVDGDIVDFPVPIDQLKRAPDGFADGLYVIQGISDHRGEPGRYEFLVEWKGYKEKTWVAERDFMDTQAIRDYWSSHHQQ